MDLATVMGLLGAVGLFAWSLWSGTGGKMDVFWNTPSVVLVIGGAIMTTLMSLALSRFLSVGSVLKNAFFASRRSTEVMIREIVSMAELARRDGILALESMSRDLEDEFLQRGIQMAVDGNDPEFIEQVLNAELDAIDTRHGEGRAVFELLGKYAPSFGMIGTLVGLVIMLKNMDDPAAIGPGMAVALLTTLYGAVIANVVALPLADKLAGRNGEEMLLKTLIIKGVISIQSGDNPRIVEQKLQTFLSPKARAAAAAEKQAA